jgi:hypothetical protein
MTEQKKSRIILHRETTLEADERKLVDDIEKYGCHVIHVKPQQPIPGWSYTIGLYETLQQPELIVVSMKQDLAHYLVNEAARRMKLGLRLAGGHREKELLENVECEFKKVEQRWAKHVMGYALWFYAKMSSMFSNASTLTSTIAFLGTMVSTRRGAIDELFYFKTPSLPPLKEISGPQMIRAAVCSIGHSQTQLTRVSIQRSGS